MIDHDAAQTIFQQFLAGVGEAEIEAALAHVATCDECARQFEIDRTAACVEVEDDLPEAAGLVRASRDVASAHPAVAAHLEECERCRVVFAQLASEPPGLGRTTPMAEIPIDPAPVFERALVTALSRPETIKRERAAERFAAFERVGSRALAALAEAAGEDPEEEVRAAALRALDELDRHVSIPQRLIEEWAEEPTEAASFIEGVLARLAGGSIHSASPVLELIGTPVPGEERTELTGADGVHGGIARTWRQWWLSLEGLPPAFENTRPLLALPDALRPGLPRMKWPAAKPGLVPAEKPVSGGSLRARIGRPPAAAQQRLFHRIFLVARPGSAPSG